MIFLVFILGLCCIATGIYAYITTKRYYILGKEFIKLSKTIKQQKADYLDDLGNVVTEISAFIQKSKFLQYSDEAKQLLIFLRSFVQQLTVHIQNQEKQAISLKDLDDDEEEGLIEEEDDIAWFK